MLGAALIVFRETLEAALLIGILAAASRGLSGRNLWLGIGIGIGLAGALVVAGLTGYIAEMAEGTGQELFNAAVLGVAVVMLGWHNIWMARHGREMAAQAKSVGVAVQSGRREMSALAVLIALSVLREGSESVLFLYGLALDGRSGAMAMFSGGVLGLLGGIAVAWMLYASLVRVPVRHFFIRVPVRHFFTVTGALILFLAAGMAAQMARFLVAPLWDTSSVLPMDSFLGSLLHLIAGYDARPSGIQVLFYTLTLGAILLGMNRNRTRSLRPA
jgi:high-affinity iron transporter